MRNHFDLLAPVYDGIIRQLLGPPDAELWAELLKLPVTGRLLDVGGGTGRVSEILIPMVGQLVIADSSFGMLRQAAKKEGLHSVQALAHRLPFSSESFDRVMVVDSLHHFARQGQVIQELARVLTPGGRLVIEDFDLNRFPVKVLAILEKLALMGSRFLYLQEQLNLIREAGLNAEIRKGKRLSVMIVATKET